MSRFLVSLLLCLAILITQIPIDFWDSLQLQEKRIILNACYAKCKELMEGKAV